MATYSLAEHVPGTPQRFRHGWIPIGDAGTKRTRKEALTPDAGFSTVRFDIYPDKGITPPPPSLDTAVMRHYSGSLAQPMNGDLRKGGHKYDKEVAALDASMSKLTAPTNLFRSVPPAAFGLPGTETQTDIDSTFAGLQKMVGKTVSDSGYLSTSSTPNNAIIKNHYIIIKMKAPAGTKAINMQPYSNYPSEREVLLHRNAKMKISAVERVTGDYTDQIIIHGELLPS